MTEVRTKVALIGAGGWGYQHARVLSSRRDVDFRAIVGRTAERTRVRAEEFGGAAGTPTSRRCWRPSKPDLVHLCLPNQGHFEATLQVIRAGVPLLVEKPLVFRLDEADTLLGGSRTPESSSSGSTSTTVMPSRYR